MAKNKDKLKPHSQQKEPSPAETKQEPTLSIKEAFLKDLRELFLKHHVNGVNTTYVRADNNRSINKFIIDMNGDDINIKSLELLNYCGWQWDN